MIRRIVAVTLTACLLLTMPSVAEADDPCKIRDTYGRCQIEIGNPGKNGETGSDDDGGTQNVGVCKAKWMGYDVPCRLPGIGFFAMVAGVGCYLKPSSTPPTDQTKPGPDYKPYACRQVVAAEDMAPVVETFELIIWWPGGGVIVTPEQAARAVAAEMSFEAIKLGVSQKLSGPQGVGYVGVPVWLWAKDPSDVTVGPQSVSKNYMGLAVTINASMTRIVWNLGDGKSVTCGPGTPYKTSYGTSESPTCGYKYKRISKSEPGGKFTISATSYWSLEWTAGGQSGTIPLDFTQSTSLRVGEIQVVVTGN